MIKYLKIENVILSDKEFKDLYLLVSLFLNFQSRF